MRRLFQLGSIGIHACALLGGIVGALWALACAPLFAQSPTFSRDVAPIFQSNCAGGRATNVRMGSLGLDSYTGLEKGGTRGKVIDPGKSAESRLYLMLSGKLAPAMPLGGKPLAEGDLTTIRNWIDAGAP